MIFDLSEYKIQASDKMMDRDESKYHSFYFAFLWSLFPPKKITAKWFLECRQCFEVICRPSKEEAIYLQCSDLFSHAGSIMLFLLF